VALASSITPLQLQAAALRQLLIGLNAAIILHHSMPEEKTTFTYKTRKLCRPSADILYGRQPDVVLG